MIVYRARNQVVIGLSGGNYFGKVQKPEALILSNKPKPVMMATREEKVKYQDCVWKETHKIKAYNAGGLEFYVHHIQFAQYKPEYKTWTYEYFRDAATIDFEGWSENNSYTIHNWNATTRQWEAKRRAVPS